VYDRTDNRLILLKDNQWCANYFIIDGSNMILADCYSHDETSKNQMHRINSNSIVVGEKYCGLGRWKTHQEIIINGKEETDYVLYKTINCLFIFIKVIVKNNTASYSHEIINSGIDIAIIIFAVSLSISFLSFLFSALYFCIMRKENEQKIYVHVQNMENTNMHLYQNL
jgi:hypothetical protein